MVLSTDNQFYSAMTHNSNATPSSANMMSPQYKNISQNLKNMQEVDDAQKA